MNEGKRIVVHIEADTFDEVMGALDEMFGGLVGRSVSVGAFDPDSPTVDATVGAKGSAPKKRTRAKAKPTATETPSEADTTPAEGEAEAPANASVLSDLTPAEARKTGIATIQAHYAKDPTNMAGIKSLQEKYGVKMFSEVPDDRAAEFHADALLLASGNGEG